MGEHFSAPEDCHPELGHKSSEFPSKHSWAKGSASTGAGGQAPDTREEEEEEEADSSSGLELRNFNL